MSLKKKPPIKPRRPRSLKSDATVIVGAPPEGTALEMQHSERPRGKTFTGRGPTSASPRRVDMEQRRRTEVRRRPEEEGGAKGISEYLKVVL